MYGRIGTAFWLPLIALVVGVLAAAPAGRAAEEVLYPARDGTLVDGGVYGPFDGVPDHWDWFFNASSYEGAITLVAEPPSSRIEHRVFWEYGLSRVSIAPPLTARLRFAIRGATVFGAPDAVVAVCEYPSDLLETPGDFSDGPERVQGTVTVATMRQINAVTIDVSRVINEALLAGRASVALRFRIAPDTSADASQAFIDADEDDPTTKPALVLTDAVPGDATGDGIVDAADIVELGPCMTGPVSEPAGVGQTCAVFDLDADGDIDLEDYRQFLWYAASAR